MTISMQAPFLMAIDQGTTGSTALIIDAKSMEVVGKKTVEFNLSYPQSGWVEQNLEDIWVSVRQAIEGACVLAEWNTKNSFDKTKIAAIGLSNQRETLTVFDRKTGEPLRPAIVWQCRRSAEICSRLVQEGCTDTIRQKTGLVVDPYFTASKISWLMENDPVAKHVNSGRAVFGTIDTYLVARLTGQRSYLTEPSNASRTQLYNLTTGEWDQELLDMFGVPSASCLPDIVSSAGSFGETVGMDFLPDGIPITGILGDQQAALAGQGCYKVGDSKCTYGTGAFLLVNIGSEPKPAPQGLLTTVAWDIGGTYHYAYEGSAFIAGAAVQYVRDELGWVQQAPDTAAMAKGVMASPEVYFVPALTGLGAPHWDPYTRGAFFGLSRGTTKNQLVRAVLEGIAFQVEDLRSEMSKEFADQLGAFRVDGGASANDVLMQFQADISQRPVDRPKNIETTAFGAALFAGLGCGRFSSLEELAGFRLSDNVFFPNKDIDVSRLHEGWVNAVRSARGFSTPKIFSQRSASADLSSKALTS